MIIATSEYIIVIPLMVLLPFPFHRLLNIADILEYISHHGPCCVRARQVLYGFCLARDPNVTRYYTYIGTKLDPGWIHQKDWQGNVCLSPQHIPNVGLVWKRSVKVEDLDEFVLI